jgi:hypothetical protein
MTSRVAVLLGLLFVSASAKAADQLDAPAVQHQIAADGAKATVKSLYSNPTAWQSLLRHISTGAPRWFDVGEALRPGSDAGASNELIAAVAESMGSNPALVLSHATGPFYLSDLCGAPDVDDHRFGSLKLALSELNRRIAAVEQVSRPELTAVRRDCLGSLRRSESDLRRYFERE